MTLCLVAAGCGRGDRLSGDELARCAQRGSPVSIGTFVEIGRANGTSLALTEPACRRLAKGAAMGSEPVVTNAGSAGLDMKQSVMAIEGALLCRVAPSARSRKIFSYRYPTDTETHLGVMNVSCSLYPSDPQHEAAQIARFRKTLEALLREVR